MRFILCFKPCYERVQQLNIYYRIQSNFAGNKQINIVSQNEPLLQIIKSITLNRRHSFNAVTVQNQRTTLVD